MQDGKDRQRFLAEFSDALRPLSDADEIVQLASRLLGEHLELDRVVYCEIDVPNDRETVYRDWTRPGVASAVGVRSVSCFGPAMISHMTSGREVVIADLRSDPLTAGEPSYEKRDFRAVICWPLVKHGRWVAALAAHGVKPRSWHHSESALVGEVANRTWEAVERAHAVDARRSSEERYRALFESIDEGFCACEVLANEQGEPHDYRLLEVNPAFASLTGLGAAVGRTMREVVPDLDPEWLEFFRETARTGQPTRVERRSQDGKYWFDVLVTRIDKGGTPKLAVLINNITDRHRAEGLLAAEKTVLEQITSSVPLRDTLDALTRQIESLSSEGLLCSVLLIDESGQHLTHGAAPSLPDAYIRAIDGIRIGPGVGSCGTAAFERRPVFVADIATDPKWSDFKALAAEHRLGACCSTPILSPHGRLLGTIAMYYRQPHDPGPHDRQLIEHATRLAAVAIERTQAEQALRESEERFRSFADTAPAMVWVTETSGECSFLSRGWYEFTGQAEESALGVGWLDAVHPDDREATRDACRVAHENRAVISLEYRVLRADGECHWVIAAGRPRFGPDGVFQGYIGSIIDITDRKQMEQALRETDRRKDEFLAMLAHELRNPLAPISSALTVLSRTGLDLGTIERMRAMMGQQIDLLVRLIDDLVDTSRISHGKLTLQRDTVELAAILRAATVSSRTHSNGFEHQVELTLPRDPLYVSGDEIRLGQVFSNLLQNARKFTAPGGRIWLTARRDGDQAVISVMDTGIGIPSGALGTIFDLFTQVDGTLERSQGGLGIGLTLVKRIVELHDGTITAHSEGPGRGSEFVVRLPVLEAPAVRPVVPTAGASSVATRLRILVVDDSRPAANVLAEVLALSGNEAHTANDGEAAIAAAASLAPDVILLDIGMPKLNGYEACRRIRDMKGGRDIAIFALTGWGQQEDRRKSREAGFDGHLVKPVNDAELMKLLARWQETRAARTRDSAADRRMLAGEPRAAVETTRPPAVTA